MRTGLSGGVCEQGKYYCCVFDLTIEEGTSRKVTNQMHCSLEDANSVGTKVWENLQNA